MRAIVYISQETQPFTPQDLTELLEVAISKNRENNVTGYLHYESGYFMQYIEGNATSLDETIDRIFADKRHVIFYRAEDEEVQQRRFPDWYMHWEDRSEANDLGTTISELTLTLKPFGQLQTHEELERAFSMYKQIAYDHSLRGMAAMKSENDEIAKLFSMAAHDLRTPVRSISTLVEMYINDTGRKIDPDFLETAEFIKVLLNRMNGLVDGILAHFEANASNVIELVDTGALVDEVTAALVTKNSRHQIDKVGDFPTIRANALQFWRVLNCLITNGLKYNQSEAPRVEVSVKREKSYWQFCVCDNGIGIHPKYQQQIFEIFQRLHHQSKYAGTGIGLATCHKLVEEWHGRIWVASEEGKGSRFYFTYPTG